MGLPPTSMMTGIASPIINTDAPTMTIPPAPVETMLEPPVPETVIPMQLPIVESQLVSSYISNHNQQACHNNTNISVCSSDSNAQENLKSHFNERLNNKSYATCEEIFDNSNIDSVHEALPKLACTIMK